ncbi:MAG: hypothetical protein EA422_13910 [Gemmatimonadales bacterium]|nr:MAG: hypothetical protein EA422_13910 [Gemmatimonadales bacterium]
MFQNLRDAFREAVQNFRTELNRDQVPEAAHRLLRAMEEELVRVRTEVKALDGQLTEVRSRAAREEEEVRKCLRREELARKIGDDETVEVARSYARRHLRMQEVLSEKGEVLEREIQVRSAEVEEMTRSLKQAKLQRESLLASSSRREARESLQDADGLFSEMDRMSERIEELDRRNQAFREVAEMDAEAPASSAEGSTHTPEAEVDARLAELKRRMAR